MKTAHLGRRLGDWLGVVPEDDVPVETSAHYFDLDELERTMIREPVEPVIAAASRVVSSSPTPPRFEPTAPPEPPAPSPVRSQGSIPEPAKNVRSFRDVVNERRSEAQRRATYPQAPPRW